MKCFQNKMFSRVLLLGLISGCLLLGGVIFQFESHVLRAYPLLLSGCETQTPRNIIIVFSSFKNKNALKLTLTTWKKYKSENWDLYIFTDVKSVKAEYKNIAKPFGANLVVINLNVYQNQRWWRVDPRTAGIQNTRMIIYRDWLRKNAEGLRPYDRVILTDEDVFFNGNPFGIFDAYPEQSLFLFAEKSGFLNKDGYNKYYIGMSTASVATANHVLEQQLYCAGVAIGTVSAIRQFLEKVVAAYVIKSFPTDRLAQSITRNHRLNKFIDQGVTNILIHTGRLDDYGLELISNEKPWVAHLASQKTRENILEFALNRTIIHQYKSVPVVKEWIIEKYGLHT